MLEESECTECMFVICMDRQCRPLFAEERHVVRSAGLVVKKGGRKVFGCSYGVHDK